MRRAAQRFINYIRSERGMTPATVHSYQEDLRKFIEFLESHWGRCLLPGDVTPDMILAFLDFLANTGYQKKNGPASRARRLVAIRSFFRYRANLVHHPRAYPPGRSEERGTNHCCNSSPYTDNRLCQPLRGRHCL
jgi:site-specific recombinase XerD